MPRGIYQRKLKTAKLSKTEMKNLIVGIKKSAIKGDIAITQNGFKPASDYFHITLNLNGQIYESVGATAFDACMNLPLDYTQIKVKGLLTISKGNRTYTHFYYLKQLRRLLASKIRKVGLARQLEELLANKGTTMSE